MALLLFLLVPILNDQLEPVRILGLACPRCIECYARTYPCEAYRDSLPSAEQLPFA